MVCDLIYLLVSYWIGLHPKLLLSIAFGDVDLNSPAPDHIVAH
jgi:hypothetical protein